MRIVELTGESKKNILNDLLKRSPNNYSEYESTVNEILEDVRKNGDSALFAYTQKFDHFALNAENIRVDRKETEEAYGKLDSGLVEVMRHSAENIREFHRKQLRSGWFDTREDGSLLGVKMTPIARAGVYVPGGKAA